MKNSVFKNKKNLFFYIAVLIIPITQIVLFYFYVNFNSILLSFKTYTQDSATGLMSESFNYFGNYKDVIHDLFYDIEIRDSLVNSLKVFVFTYIFGVFLSTIFSYYIYKKYAGSVFYRLVLFLPQIISSVVMVLLFKMLADEMIPAAADKLFHYEFEGLLANPDSRFPSIVFYSIFIGYGSNILLFSSSMAEINESVIEAGRLDGTNFLQEFFHIIVPAVWPTLITLTIVSIAGIFVNQLNLYTLYGTKGLPNSKISVMGYYLFYKAERGSIVDYPYLSAMGVIFSLILFPITMIVRKMMKKFGPSIE